MTWLFYKKSLLSQKEARLAAIKNDLPPPPNLETCSSYLRELVVFEKFFFFQVGILNSVLEGKVSDSIHAVIKDLYAGGDSIVFKTRVLNVLHHHHYCCNSVKILDS